MGEFRIGTSSNGSHSARAPTAVAGSAMHVPDYKQDVLFMGHIFRNANEEDTLSTLNAISNSAAVESLSFYAVPASWFRRVWPVLTARTADDLDIDESWREQMGIIRNADLVVDPKQQQQQLEAVTTGKDDSNDDHHHDNEDDGRTNNGSSNSNNNKNGTNGNHKAFDLSIEEQRNQRIHQLIQRQKRSVEKRPHKMKSGLVHARDFVFLGPRTWTLVKSKFGFDGYEVSRSCVSIPPNGNQSNSNIAIALLPGEATVNGKTIAIPAGGYFPYESFMMMDQPGGAKAAPNSDENFPVVDGKMDEDHFSPGPKINVVLANEKIEARAAPADQEVEDRAIICLPNSTTAMAEGSPLASSIGGDAMDVDMSEKGGCSVTSDGNGSGRYSGRKRVASGLGNLGNTCFMNSTLQCLAHTDPIRRYFLSGEYRADLNKENPLGTKGQLAEEFANLMVEMWGIPSKKRNVMGIYNYSSSNYSSPYSNAVFPREFKTCLGKHAEQFMGYDQHDSQELATYLLDALHEDTNRVTKKPYVEKPEQGEDESDEEAARVAWDLHLRREDSRVLENFMGQIKSRLECCEEGCDRVSTTFDPFMFLSVPIPGSNERTLKATFVPLDPMKRMKTLALTLPKTALMIDLMSKMNEELVQVGVIDKPVPLDNLVAIDVFTNKVYKWYEQKEELSKVRDNDKTYIYELAFIDKGEDVNNGVYSGPSDGVLNVPVTRREDRLKPDLATLMQLNSDQKWQEKLGSYMKGQSLGHLRYFNPRKTSPEERMLFHKKLDNFIDECYQALAKNEEASGRLKRTRDEATSDESFETTASDPFEEVVEGLVNCSDASEIFEKVQTKTDVAILDFCSKKYSSMMIDFLRSTKPEWIDIDVWIRKAKDRDHYSYSNHYGAVDVPMVLRLSADTTIYALRKELAHRLSRSLKKPETTDSNKIEEIAEAGGKATGEKDGMQDDSAAATDSCQLEILRETALSLAPDGCSTSYSLSQPIGSVRFYNDDTWNRDDTKKDGGGSKRAEQDDLEEQKSIGEISSGRRRVTLCIQWKNTAKSIAFDPNEYSAEDEDRGEDLAVKATGGEGPLTIQKCIGMYCQKEQLEDTEMWYCSTCQKHVRAWKQFHLFRAPPILIIHLKRFSYAANSHRRDKISKLVDFPLEGLDLREFVSHYSEDDKPIYDCYAVSNHFGGLGGGHYTAYILSDDGTWCYYDDASVRTNEDPKKVVSTAAYVLYYRRRDVPVGGQDEIFVDSRVSSPMMVCEEEGDGSADAEQAQSELSSNTALAGDLDATMDTRSNSSSKSAAHMEPSIGALFDDDDPIPSRVMVPPKEEDFPRQ